MAAPQPSPTAAAAASSTQLPPPSCTHASHIAHKLRQARQTGEPFWSLEFFPPKTAQGLANLYARIARMTAGTDVVAADASFPSSSSSSASPSSSTSPSSAAATAARRPRWVNVTWGAGGTTRSTSLELAARIQTGRLDASVPLVRSSALTPVSPPSPPPDDGEAEAATNAKANNVTATAPSSSPIQCPAPLLPQTPVEKSLASDVCLHLTCTNVLRSSLDATLDEAVSLGIRNILALRGDPPRGHEYWVAADERFQHAEDLVRYIRQRHGDHFCIGVAGYPEGHPDTDRSDASSPDVAYLLRKQAAGASFVITQLFYCADTFLEWYRGLRRAGVTMPVVPGVMPIQNYQSFRRMTNLCRVRVPQEVLDALEPIKADDALVKDFGVRHAMYLVSRIFLESDLRGFHFCTLNLEKSVRRVLEGLEWIPTPSDARSRLESSAVAAGGAQQQATEARRQAALTAAAAPPGMPHSQLQAQSPSGRSPSGSASGSPELRRNLMLADDAATRHLPADLVLSPEEAMHQTLSRASLLLRPPQPTKSRRPTSSADALPVAATAAAQGVKATAKVAAGGAGSEAQTASLEVPWTPRPPPPPPSTATTATASANTTQGATWDEFPNGRYGDSRSPAYGEMDGYGASLKVPAADALRLWGHPTSEADLSQLFASFLSGQLRCIPWCDVPVANETSAIRSPLVRLNLSGRWTVGSQPAIDGVRSEDPTFGFGPRGGYVFQKPFVEFFVDRQGKEALRRRLMRGEFGCANGDGNGDGDGDDDGPEATSHSHDLGKATAKKRVGSSSSADAGAVASAADETCVSFYATNRAGDWETNMSAGEVSAVTWGVFPGQEIVQPTIIEEQSFKAWAEEAFAIWAEWEQLFPPGSASRELLSRVGRERWLVTLVHHDYKRPDALWKFLGVA